MVRVSTPSFIVLRESFIPFKGLLLLDKRFLEIFDSVRRSTHTLDFFNSPYPSSFSLLVEESLYRFP